MGLDRAVLVVQPRHLVSTDSQERHLNCLSCGSQTEGRITAVNANKMPEKSEVMIGGNFTLDECIIEGA